MTSSAAAVCSLADAKAAASCDLSDRVWDTPELNFAEFQSAAHRDMLEREGFRVTAGLAANGLEGRLRYYGCPAEEGGSAKGFMVRAGCFDDVDVAISWYPAAFTGVNTPISLACNEIEFAFAGRAAHAAGAPHLGRSALDTVELMNVGVNYMREHMPSSARIHYAVIDAGGIAPKADHAERLAGKAFVNPIPDDVQPALPGNAHV